MRFLLLRYKKDPLSEDSGLDIGVLVQDGKQILFDYTKEVDNIKKYDSNVDEFLINSLDSTIKSLISEKKMYVSSPSGAMIQTTPQDVEFLEDLKRSYQGKIQFSKIREVNYPTAKEALKELFNQYVVKQ